MRKYKDYLEDKKREAEEEKKLTQYTDNDEVNELRQLVEDMTKWMSIGNNRANIPKKVIDEFKATMKRANYIKATNMAHRQK
tara:strand:+ start:107 stop:352 length:246 start_codon:yes stop_codon:yes gene_type:complete